jgi:signal transduction histidine kinase
MRTFAVSCVALGLSAALVVAPRARADEGQSKAPTPESIMNLVQEAASLIEIDGEKAFAQFNDKGSKWFENGTYVFVNDLQGKILVCPEFPNLVGRDAIDMKDPQGRPIIASMINVVSVEPRAGWVHYVWPIAEGSDVMRWKASYVTRATTPSGQRFIVGSGLTDDKPNKFFVEDTVDRAVARIEAQGDEAFAALRNKLGPFVYRDTYVFVFNNDGTELVNPQFSELVGKDVFDVKDSTGKSPAKEMVEALAKTNSAWVEYQWPKPAQTEPSKKSAYVRKIDLDGRTLYVGAGLYLD